MIRNLCWILFVVVPLTPGCLFLVALAAGAGLCGLRRAEIVIQINLDLVLDTIIRLGPRSRRGS